MNSTSSGPLFRLLGGLWVGLALVGCDPETAPAPNGGLDYTHPLAEGESICGRPDFNALFPYSLRSEKLPVLVHYYKPVELEAARQVLAAVEKGWDYHVNQLGMRPALTDHGACGPDNDFDVFVWKGHRSCLVDVIEPEPSTSWDDRTGYMIMDPWGPYGGPELEETVVHEMAHASQAADDWSEAGITYEMSAVFTDQVYADRYIKIYLDDFQAHPDWALDYNDNYETWYMYGSSLYLLYLKDRFFDGRPQFISRLWLESRNPPVGDLGQVGNEPDFTDALDQILGEKAGSSFLATVPEFSRWRWYTGDHIDSKHFRHFSAGLENLQQAKLALAAQVESKPGRVEIRDSAPMMLGTSYIELTDTGGTGFIDVSLEAPAAAGRRFIIQAVPGLTPDSDGEILDVVSGKKTVKFPADHQRTLIVTALPTGPYDPDLRTEERYPFTLVLSESP